MEVLLIIIILAVILLIYEERRDLHTFFRKRKDLKDFYSDIFKDIESKYPSKPPKTSMFPTDPAYYADSKKLHKFIVMKNSYLLSPKWKNKRTLVLRRDKGRCRICDSSYRLEVHHTRYDLVPNEPIDHLVTLCRDCHEEQHSIHGYPRSFKDYMEWNYPI